MIPLRSKINIERDLWNQVFHSSCYLIFARTYQLAYCPVTKVINERFRSPLWRRLKNRLSSGYHLVSFGESG